MQRKSKQLKLRKVSTRRSNDQDYKLRDIRKSNYLGPSKYLADFRELPNYHSGLLLLCFQQQRSQPSHSPSFSTQERTKALGFPETQAGAPSDRQAPTLDHLLPLAIPPTDFTRSPKSQPTLLPSPPSAASKSSRPGLDRLSLCAYI